MGLDMRAFTTAEEAAAWAAVLEEHGALKVRVAELEQEATGLRERLASYPKGYLGALDARDEAQREARRVQRELEAITKQYEELREVAAKYDRWIAALTDEEWDRLAALEGLRGCRERNEELAAEVEREKGTAAELFAVVGRIGEALGIRDTTPELCREVELEARALRHAAHMPEDWPHNLASWVNQRLYAAYLGLHFSEEVMQEIADGRLTFPESPAHRRMVELEKENAELRTRLAEQAALAGHGY